MSDARSYLEQRVVSSAYIAISQITSGKSLMYSWKNVRPRMEP